jgi:hypothetical protein
VKSWVKSGEESHADRHAQSQHTMANQVDRANQTLSNLDLVQNCDKYEFMITKAISLV